MSDPAHRPLLEVWAQAYAQSLVDPGGPWGGFARAIVEDRLALLSTVRPAAAPDADRTPTLALAVLRGALLDLLATGDVSRTTQAVESWLKSPSSQR